MTASSLIIAADRGSLRAYRAYETPTRGVHLELVQAFEVTDVMNAASMRRVCKELATEIAKIVRRNPGEGWAFAAPESIYAKVVEHLPREIQEQMVEHVASDLVKLPAAALPSHFRSLQPI
jgi:hypothetical protein